MSIIDLTEVPTQVSMSLSGSTGLFVSGLTGSVQSIDRGGFRWEAIYTFTNVHHSKRATLMAVIAALRSQANRIRIPVHDNPKQGGYGGTPLVAGGSQTGSSIDLDGVTNKTDWIKAGDYFGITVNGELELKMCTADTDSAAGLITIPFEPRLRASPLNNAVVIVDDGVLGSPTGIFLARDPTIGWSSRPFQSGSALSSVTFSLIEDLFASQA